MQIRIFTIPLTANVDEQEEMNRFLRANKVLTVQKEYDQNRGVWTFAVEFLPVSAGSKMAENRSAGEKVDYKEVLGAEEFERFSEYRRRRKAIAAEESVPAFAIFTDRELAEMSKISDLSPEMLKKIEGINSARIAHYGIRLLEGKDQGPEQ